jgi:enterochelin esterase-like enzyme/sugar lactone lactonase YvrE
MIRTPLLQVLGCAAAFIILGGVADRAAAAAEDWGGYAIGPVSAPGMMLEVSGGTPAEGAVVTIGKQTGAPGQKWAVAARGEGLFVVHPLGEAGLVLAVRDAGTKNGSAVVLEKDGGKDSQVWSLTKQESGSYVLSPKHAPGMGLDDFGGNQQPGARIDLWQHKPGDAHVQWLIRPLAGSGVSQAAEPAAMATYEAPKVSAEQIRAGEIKQFQFTQSAIFPGTVREVTVFIPAQYDGTKPACVYVKTDGYNPREKALLEEMMAAGEMPVTVGVFVRPGDLPAPVKGTLGRRNRDFEYDAVNDNHVRFVTEELLPYIEREYGLRLSHSGNDRCMSGGSSGGIAAFNAAWQRPEEFSRVYAASGSFVAFRGGHEFPTMVRKYEAKPIRAFLTTATHDMENAAGDWYLVDQEMDKALKFSGYDYVFRTIEGRHVAGYMENFREAMAYLWKGWPEPVKAGPSAPRAQDVLVPGENWRRVEGQFSAARAAAVNARGEVYMIEADRIERIGVDGKILEFAKAGDANGITVGPDGTVYTVSESTGRLTAYDAAGKAKVVMEKAPGHSIVAMPEGGLYVTRGEEVWRLKDGKAERVGAGLKRATGLAYRPDRWLLNVGDGASRWAHSFQIGEDGTLRNGERYFWLHVDDSDDDAGVEGMCYALEGQMFVATRIGIQVCADDGPAQVILPMPDRKRVEAVCLGGPEMDTLFAFCGDAIWARKVKVHACGAFSAWTKVNGTKL